MAATQLDSSIRPDAGNASPPDRQGKLGRLDTISLMIAATVVLDTLGAVALGGTQTLTWLLIVGLFFFFPAGMAIAELGSTFPHEGGPYAWTRTAFGRRVGSFVALAYWTETTVWLGGSLAITAVAVVNHLIVPVAGLGRVALALAFIWAATLLAAAPLGSAKRFAVVGTAVQAGLLALFSGTVALYATRHGTQELLMADAVPSWSVAFLVAPVLVYSFLGLEMPSAAADEMKDPQRDVPPAIARAGTIITILYSVPILGILLVVPATEQTGLTGFIDAIDTVFTVYGPAADAMRALSGAAFIWVLLANGQTWLLGSTRAQAVASLDGAGPTALGRIARRTGTPVRSTIVSGLGATATALAAFAVAGNDDNTYFAIVLSLSIALLALSNLFVFPALVRLRSSHPLVLRPFRVPGGTIGAWFTSSLATGWIVLALASVLWPGLGSPSPDSYLPDGFAGNRLGLFVAQLVPFIGFCAAAVLFGHVKQRHRVAANASPELGGT